MEALLEFRLDSSVDRQCYLSPINVDGEPEYEISKIFNSKLNQQYKCKLLYLVKWAGYEGTEEESLWISATELEHASEAVSDFHQSYPDKPGPLSSL